jgi:hypothetical protein
MPKPTNTSPHALTVPNEVLRQLADVARVPAEQHEFFFDSVLTHVLKTAWELDGLVKNGLATLAIKRREKLIQAALTLYDTLGNLNNRECAFIEGILGGEAKCLFDRISSGGVDGLKETAYQLARLFSLVTGKPPPRYPSQLPETPGRGRKSGTVKDWIFQKFVWDLLIPTTEAGGRLTLEKNTPAGGLIEAIEILTPYLPGGFVPVPLPGSMLQRLKDRCSRMEKAAEELNRDLPDDLS